MWIFRRRVSPAVLLTLVAVAAGLRAQTPPQQPTFRTGIDLVTVDAIVTDKQGNPVLDLTAADFEVKERGKIQKIDSFKLVQASEAIDPDSSSFREIVSEADQERETARDDVRVIVILLDDYHVERMNSLAVRDRLAAFVRQINPRDLVAIMYPLTPVTGLTFSRNREEQARVIAQFTGRKHDYFPQNRAEETYQFCSPQQIEGIRDGVTLSALRGVSTYLGTLRERRNTVLFVSEGTGETLARRISPPGAGRCTVPGAMARMDNQRAADGHSILESTALQSNTAIYTLDPRGVAFEDFDMRDSQEEAAAGRRRVASLQEFLRNLAYQTGGRAIVGTNNLEGLLPQMLRDTGAYYLMGYTSTERFRDGKFHEIEVHVKRKDVELRARKGYWAYNDAEIAKSTAPPKPRPPSAVLSALSELAESPRGHAIRTWVGTAKGAGGKTDVTVVWEPLAGAASGPATQARITAISPDGDTPYFDGVGDRAEGAGQVGGHVTFAAKPGVFRLKVVATAADGHEIDAIDRDVSVSDFSGTATSISAPFVFRGRTARDIQQIKAAVSPQPTASREFSRADRLLVRFRAYGPGGVSPTVTIRFLNQAGQPMATLPPPTATADGGLETEVGLAPLAAGDYLIEITAHAETGDAQAFIAFRISG